MRGQIRLKLLDERTKQKTELQSGDTLCVMKRDGTVGFFRKGTRLVGDSDDKILADGGDIRAFLRHFGVILTKYSENGGSEFFRMTLK